MAFNTPYNTSDNSDPQQGTPPDPAGAAPSAADIIRQKLDRIYQEEPQAANELTEAKNTPRRSKHQEFMYKLGTSGKDLATIQTEWHNYYQSLPTEEKHQVWQEFYASQSLLTGQASQSSQTGKAAQTLARHKHQAARPERPRRKPTKQAAASTPQEIKKVIRDKVSAGGKLEVKHHMQSLLFGLGMGFVVLLIFLFGFFNEIVIAPFIQPSRVSESTPLIVSDNSVAPSNKPEVIIPKINVEIPTDYSQTTTNEAAIENALEDGVVHYPTTTMPGQTGNTAFFGHSSNNIFNKGKYKFAFVLLHTLVEGDTFYLTYNGKVYVYKVISRKIVDPSEVGVLGPVPGQTATATLITCDPPGTSLHRLVVVGQQVSPDPSGNSAPPSTASTSTTTEPASLPGNGPTLWGRFIGTAAGKTIITTVIAGIVLLTVRRLNQTIFDRV